jgi:serine/threonine protein kinase
MGSVWSVLDMHERRQVAIKFPTLTSPQILERFSREASALELLTNENSYDDGPLLPSVIREGLKHITAFYPSDPSNPIRSQDVTSFLTVPPELIGDTNEIPCIMMEVLTGTNLEDMLDRQKKISDSPWLSLKYAVELIKGPVYALLLMEEKGIVHRDIKPGNFIDVPKRGLVLIDFGIARDPSSNMTMDGTVMGTPGYIAPEQILCRAATPKADLYALGTVFWEMITGSECFKENPFSVGAPSTMEKRQNPDPIVSTLTQLNHPMIENQTAMELLVKIFGNALAFKPEDRYPGTSERSGLLYLLDDLNSLKKACPNECDSEENKPAIPKNWTTMQREEK